MPESLILTPDPADGIGRDAEVDASGIEEGERANQVACVASTIGPNTFSVGFMKYFAYRSNMLEQRLKARVPGAVCLTKAFAGGYRLRFHKKGLDKSGKCNIIQTESMENLVHGVLFEIPEAQLEKLDDAEGYGQGYNHATIPVHLPDGTTESALAYVADPNAVDDKRVPYSWYHELVVAGAEQHGLPADYIARLREQRRVTDPRPNRDSKVEAEKVLAEYRNEGKHIE